MSTCYLALYFECYFPTPLQRDLDGGLKIMLDAVCRGLGANDNRVVEIHLSKRIRPQDPHVYVEIDTLDEWEFDEEYRVLPKGPEGRRSPEKRTVNGVNPPYHATLFPHRWDGPRMVLEVLHRCA
jgi:hypothetical protein